MMSSALFMAMLGLAPRTTALNTAQVAFVGCSVPVPSQSCQLSASWSGSALSEQQNSGSAVLSHVWTYVHCTRLPTRMLSRTVSVEAVSQLRQTVGAGRIARIRSNPGSAARFRCCPLPGAPGYERPLYGRGRARSTDSAVNRVGAPSLAERP